MRKIFFYFGLFAIMPTLLLATGSAFAGTVRIVVPSHDIARGETIGERSHLHSDGSASLSGAHRIEEVKACGTAGCSSPDNSAPKCAAPSSSPRARRSPCSSSLGVELTAMGRAMSEGGVGDTVTVRIRFLTA